MAGPAASRTLRDAYVCFASNHTYEPHRSAPGVVGFAAAALLVASVGVYRVIAFGISRRRRELGIRMALGAGPQTIVREVMRGGLTLVLLGLAIGVPVAWILAAFLESLLFGVEARDPAVFLLATGILTATAVAAIYLPARSAGRVDSSGVLRAE